MEHKLIVNCVLSILIFFSLTFLVYYSSIFISATEGTNFVSRVSLTLSKVSASYIFILRNRRFSRLNYNVFFFNFLILFLALIISHQLVFGAGLIMSTSVIFIPVVAIILAFLSSKANNFNPNTETNLIRDILYYIIAFVSISEFKLEAPIVESSINLVIIVFSILLGWSKDGGYGKEKYLTRKLLSFSKVLSYLSFLLLFETFGDQVFFEYRLASLFGVFLLTLLFHSILSGISFAGNKDLVSLKSISIQNLIIAICLGKLCLYFLII